MMETNICPLCHILEQYLNSNLGVQIKEFSDIIESSLMCGIEQQAYGLSFLFHQLGYMSPLTANK